MRKVTYNSQRDNIDFAGKFPGWMQCFSTCAWMFISYYYPIYDGDNDELLSLYVDDVEDSVGIAGTAEKVIARLKLKIKGHSSFYWKIHQEAIQYRLTPTSKEIIYNEHFPINQLPEIIKAGPVIIGTNKLGGLPGGYIILLVDYINKFEDLFIINDPYGDATTNYSNRWGESVGYGKKLLEKHINYGNNQCRVIYAV